MHVALDVGNVLVGVDFSNFIKQYDKITCNIRENKVGPNIAPLEFLNMLQAQQDIGIKSLDVALREQFKLNERDIHLMLDAWDSSIIINEKMLDFTDELIKNDIKIAILSNMGHDHAEYIKNKHPRIFDNKTLHLSCEVGARKPSKLYYQSFLMQHPEFAGCLFVDDRSENLTAAESFEFRSWHFELDNFVKQSDEKQNKILNMIKEEITIKEPVIPNSRWH